MGNTPSAKVYSVKCCDELVQAIYVWDHQQYITHLRIYSCSKCNKGYLWDPYSLRFFRLKQLNSTDVRQLERQGEEPIPEA